MVYDQQLQKVISDIPQQQQVQYSTLEQLEQLIGVANKLGLYDAADFLKHHINVTLSQAST